MVADMSHAARIDRIGVVPSIDRTRGMIVAPGIFAPCALGERHCFVDGIRGVDEGDEPRQLVRILQHALPFALVVLHMPLHCGLEFPSQAKRVVAADLAHVI